MKVAFAIYRLGALGLILTAGVFTEEPLLALLRGNSSSWASVTILFGFAVAAGLFLIFIGPGRFQESGNKLMLFSHGAALISVIWLVLWCFVWLAMMTNMGEKAE